MFGRIRSFLASHPALKQALFWALPAILFGAVVRLLLLSYQPYAYWGSDSQSYYGFAGKLLGEGYFSLNEKRRFLYPILMVPVSILPGSPLKWLAWLQHGLGLISLVPLAYIVRKTLVNWRVLIVPITVIYAGFPVIVWYEHELLGENLFFALLLWSFAGWVACISQKELARAQRLFWLFFIPFTLFILTKPSGRFVWPGLAVGFVLVAGWRILQWRHYAALLGLMVVTLVVGEKKQGAWLFYVSTFPLTQIDAPAHADYKAEIREKVIGFRQNVATYYREDGWAFEFLKDPGSQSAYPLWKKTLGDSDKKTKLYMDLALEGVKAEPALFLSLGIQRLIFSANPSQFKEERFDSERYVRKLQDLYEDVKQKDNKSLRRVFGFSQTEVLPPYSEFQKRLSPAPEGWASRTIRGYVQWFDRVSDLVQLPNKANASERAMSNARPTWLGWWMLSALVLALLPRYRATLGVWMLVACGYLSGVFLVSQINPRYFGLAWPVFIVLFGLPLDLFISALRKIFHSEVA